MSKINSSKRSNKQSGKKRTKVSKFSHDRDRACQRVFNCSIQEIARKEYEEDDLNDLPYLLVWGFGLYSLLNGQTHVKIKDIKIFEELFHYNIPIHRPAAS